MNWRLLLVTLLPSIIFCLVVSRQQVTQCFRLPYTNPMSAEAALASTLLSESTDIENWNPIVTFSDSWFKYDVQVINDEKLALEVKNPESYKETDAILSIVTNEGTTTVTYGESGYIARGVTLDNLPNLIQSGSIGGHISGGMFIPANSLFAFEQSGLICINISLEESSDIPIFIVCWTFVVGLLILIREMISIVRNGFLD